jgi:hypothetical protein
MLSTDKVPPSLRQRQRQLVRYRDAPLLCASCGAALGQYQFGRPRRYCSRSCRDRAFRGRFKRDESAPKAPTADSPSNGHFRTKLLNEPNALRGRKTPLEKAGLYWTKVNDVTWKLTDGRPWRTPASFGQWGGYTTEWPVAWAIDTGWAGGRSEWHAHCGVEGLRADKFCAG